MSAKTLEQVVLVVDDDVDARLALMELLNDAGYEAVTARDGIEALHLLRAGLRPVAMLVDLRMPLMDGKMLCAECDLQPELVSIPRIIVSGDRAAGKRIALARAHPFVPKPIDPALLLKVLWSASRESQQRH